MSRSRKKQPFLSFHSYESCRQYRTQENQALRHCVKQLLHCEKYDLFPHKQECGNEWDSPRDGKYYTKLPEDGVELAWYLNWYTKAMRK